MAHRRPLLPLAPDLATHIEMYPACEHQNEAECMVSDHIAVDLGHVADHNVALGQLREHVVLQAGDRRLQPAQAFGPLQQGRHDHAPVDVVLGQRVDDLQIGRHGPHLFKLVRC